MQYDFDKTDARRRTDSYKWQKYGAEVIPLWVADMEFDAAEPIVTALRERVEQKVYGYPAEDAHLRSVIRQHIRIHHSWSVGHGDIFFLPGIVSGLNFVCQAYTAENDAVLLQSPVYHHFFTGPQTHSRIISDAPLARSPSGRYEIDFDAFSAAITPQTKIFMLCNPHNPVGRVYTRTELEQLAEICLRRKLIICSDEIHCDLIYPGSEHIAIASLSREVADQTVTLMSPSKTYNLAGLHFAFAVIQNSELKKQWEKAVFGLNPWLNIMGQTAALAAYRGGDEWLKQVLEYLAHNRALVEKWVRDEMSSLCLSPIEATYLAWLDCRGASLPANPCRFFLENARVALSAGEQFGRSGEGFVRLNFACPRMMLTDALERMAGALRRCAGSAVPA